MSQDPAFDSAIGNTRAPATVGAQAGRAVERRVRLQVALITAAAIALYLFVRQLPTGTNLSHLDFRVPSGNSIEFCDPSNPQYIPVVAVPSPVSMSVASARPSVAGEAAECSVLLKTSGDKPIGPEDLLVTHTERLHLLVFDPDLQDYQHAHPVPGTRPGEWRFGFTPIRSGTYRVFADFTPAATGRGLYASADLVVTAGTKAAMSAAPSATETSDGALHVARDELVFRLKAAQQPLRSGEVAEFEFSARDSSGADVRLERVMDAFAHLVAVDRERNGFAHLHPAEWNPSSPGENAPSRLAFKVALPKPGRYVIWAQVRVQGRDRYAPFWFDVL